MIKGGFLDSIYYLVITTIIDKDRLNTLRVQNTFEDFGSDLDYLECKILEEELLRTCVFLRHPYISAAQLQEWSMRKRVTYRAGSKEKFPKRIEKICPSLPQPQLAVADMVQIFIFSLNWAKK